MAELKGHNLVDTSQNSLKCKSGHLNIDPNRYVNYENCYNGRVDKGAQSSQYYTDLSAKLISLSKY